MRSDVAASFNVHLYQMFWGINSPRQVIAISSAWCLIRKCFYLYGRKETLPPRRTAGDLTPVRQLNNLTWGTVNNVLDRRCISLNAVWNLFEVKFSSVVYVADKLMPCCTQSRWCPEFTLLNKNGVCGGVSCSSIPTPCFEGRAYVYKCFRNVSSVLPIVLLTRINFDVHKVCCLQHFISEKQKRMLV